MCRPAQSINIDGGQPTQSTKCIDGGQPTQSTKCIDGGQGGTLKPIWIVIITVIVTAIVTAVVVGASGYLYVDYLNQRAEDENAELQEQVDVLTDQYTLLKKSSDATTSDSSSSSSSSSSSNVTDDWKTYTNTTYNFTITFTDLWSGYDVVAEKLTGSEYLYWVYVPTTDESYSYDKPGFVAPIAISIYSLDQWATVSATEGPKPTKVDENDTYVLAYSTWQDAPEDLLDSGLADEVTSVAKTAKFTD